ncbi:hypothetical protein EUTSA_v10028961mg [Eutrema salsugineum]|uniref:Bifunctional inhibitor/plant lipid transfer protein/seed storage helical domain-containing protein n=1 Tax=Eutrema salsugineum TaxID=72664 RepID=V4L8N2_EUTSA|nr:non-specific lipid-transfer protein-like protein At2g13820 isoform X1 [Eutrema salsugineum]ESQ38727.1 hypothetical protein EUTSA_v10028961mg [Eutrema salsugineum]
MTQSVLLSVFILLLSSSSSFVAPIHARKSNPAKSPSVVATPAPGPSNSDCSTVIYDMMDCLSYLTPGSNDTMPGKACCDGIESVLKYNPKCICVGLQSSQSMGMALNNTRALAVPKTCKIPIAAPHCGIIPGASTPGASTPGVSPVSPSAGTPMTSPSSAESPTTSPSLAESPAMTAPSPSSSGTTNLSVSTLTRVAVIISSMSYISAFSN